MQHTNTSSMSCGSTTNLHYRDLGEMEKEEWAGEDLFSLKPVGCFWAFLSFLVNSDTRHRGSEQPNLGKPKSFGELKR